MQVVELSPLGYHPLSPSGTPKLWQFLPGIHKQRKRQVNVSSPLTLHFCQRSQLTSVSSCLVTRCWQHKHEWSSRGGICPASQAAPSQGLCTCCNCCPPSSNTLLSAKPPVWLPSHWETSQMLGGELAPLDPFHSGSNGNSYNWVSPHSRYLLAFPACQTADKTTHYLGIYRMFDPSIWYHIKPGKLLYSRGDRGVCVFSRDPLVVSHTTSPEAARLIDVGDGMACERHTVSASVEAVIYRDGAPSSGCSLCLKSTNFIWLCSW